MYCANSLIAENFRNVPNLFNHFDTGEIAENSPFSGGPTGLWGQLIVGMGEVDSAVRIIVDGTIWVYLISQTH